MAILGSKELSFPSPLRPDDEITLESICTDLRTSRSRPEIGIVTTRILLANQRGELVMEMSITFMVSRHGQSTTFGCCAGDGNKLLVADVLREFFAACHRLVAIA